MDALHARPRWVGALALLFFVDAAISGPNDIVLLDEAGAFPHSFELAKLLEENPDTQVVVATLPDCPSMEMIKPRFEIVRGRERAEFYSD